MGVVVELREDKVGAGSFWDTPTLVTAKDIDRLPESGPLYDHEIVDEPQTVGSEKLLKEREVIGIALGDTGEEGFF